MKTLIRISLLLLVLSFSTFGQVRIPIEPYTMQVPDVSFLEVKGLDYRYDYVTPDYIQVSPDSVIASVAYFNGEIVTKQEFQTVYYKLLKADGRTAWDGNWNVPIGIYNNITHYVKRTVTGSTVATLREFFAVSGMSEIKPVLPEE